MSCADELRGLGEVREALRSKGGDILAVSTDPIERLISGRQANPKLPCVLTSDEGGVAIKALHLVHESFSKVGKTLAVPANILLDDKGRVVWAHYASIVMDRPAPGSVLQKVLALSPNEALLGKRK